MPGVFSALFQATNGVTAGGATGAAATADTGSKSGGGSHNIARNANWLVLDGPVDPTWVEDLNSVMDDSKMLTLASGERIKMNPSTRIVLETGDIRNASPATISRAGVVYLSSFDLGWVPIVESFCAILRPEARDLVMAMFRRYVSGDDVALALVDGGVNSVLQRSGVQSALESSRRDDGVTDTVVHRELPTRAWLRLSSGVQGSTADAHKAITEARAAALCGSEQSVDSRRRRNRSQRTKSSILTEVSEGKLLALGQLAQQRGGALFLFLQRFGQLPFALHPVQVVSSIVTLLGAALEDHDVLSSLLLAADDSGQASPDSKASSGRPTKKQGARFMFPGDRAGHDGLNRLTGQNLNTALDGLERYFVVLLTNLVGSHLDSTRGRPLLEAYMYALGAPRPRSSRHGSYERGQKESDVLAPTASYFCAFPRLFFSGLSSKGQSPRLESP